MKQLRKITQLTVLCAITLVSAASAHTIEQLYMTLEVEDRDWKINITFDAGYALPELRDNPDTPQPKRAWLLAQSPREHERLRHEASAYITHTLTVRHDGREAPYTITFPDYQTSPPSFPSLLNGGAYFNMAITGTVDPYVGGDFVLSVSPKAKPNFIVARGANDSYSYKVIAPGTREVLFSTSATGDHGMVPAGSPSKANLSILSLGYVHVLPHGPDHILFILTLFLMARCWQPLLYQSLAFTLAHSLTLGLVSLNVINLSTWAAVRMVEPAIALSIIILAGQNIICQKPSPHRLLLVFFFGLVHGLGFAGNLQPIIQDNPSGFIALFLANSGVELAQITILAMAWLLTMGWWQSAHYDRIRILLSAVICAAGIYWLTQRLLFT